MNRLLASAFVLFLLSACSSSSTGTGSVVAHAADAYCDHLLLCDLGQGSTDRAMVSSAADCRARLEAVLRSDLDVQAFVDDGTVRVDAGRLRACLDAVAANGCVPMDRIPACRQVYVGKVLGGAGCVDDVQCVSGACTAGLAQCGTCLAPAAVGEACDLANDDCVSSPDGNVRCEPSGVGGGGICVLDTTTYLAVGLDQDCSNNGGVRRYCDNPYYCDANDRCAQRAAVGQPCDPNLDACVFGATCGDPGGGNFVCLDVVVVTTAGDPCGDLASGAFGSCDRSRRLYCDTNANNGDVCAVLAGDGSQNSDCLVASDCDANLVCVISDALDLPGTCETKNKADATACDSDLECASHYCAQPIGGGQSVCSTLPACP